MATRSRATRTVRAVDTKKPQKPQRLAGGKAQRDLPPAPDDPTLKGKAKATSEHLPGMEEHAEKMKAEKRARAQKAAMDGPLRIHVTKAVSVERQETGAVIVTVHAELVKEQEPFRFLEVVALRRKLVKLSTKSFHAFARLKEIVTGGEGGDEGVSWTRLTLVGPQSIDGVAGRTLSIEEADEADATGV